MKEFVVLEHYVQYMRAQLEHLRAAYEHLYNLDSYITELQMYIHKVCSRTHSLSAAFQCGRLECAFTTFHRLSTP